MALAYRQDVFTLPGYKAGVDLSGNQYRFVKQGASAGLATPITAATDRPIAVQQGSPTSTVGDSNLDLVMVGIVILKADAAIAAGAEIQASADGDAKTAVATGYVAGFALQAATAAGDQIACVVNLINPPLKA